MSTMKHIRTSVFGASQKEFAEIAGVHQATVSRWDRGEFFPEIEAMRNIRNAARERSLYWEDAYFFDAPGAWQERNDGSV